MSDINEKRRWIVNGFSFENEAEAKQAVKEAEGIKYIRQQTDMNNPESVCGIYNKMIQQDLFETAVGFAYLKTLQEYLVKVPYLKAEDILPIPVQHPALEENIRLSIKGVTKAAGKETRESVQSQREKVKDGKYKKKFHIMAIVSIVLTLCVIGMFIISITSNNLTILNYENELINKYEAWENELNEREAVLKDRELEMGILD